MNIFTKNNKLINFNQIKSNILIATAYNIFIIIFVLFLEIFSDDKTGIGLAPVIFLIPLFFIIHFIFILRASSVGDKKILTRLITVILFNIVAFFIDIILIIFVLQIFFEPLILSRYK